jgi:hypothetical protein
MLGLEWMNEWYAGGGEVGNVCGRESVCGKFRVVRSLGEEDFGLDLDLDRDGDGLE